MVVRRFAWLLIALLLAACSGGGSGSSGFDTESAAIQQALRTDTCVVRDGLTICPADQQPLPTRTATPAATPAATQTTPPISAATATARAVTATPTTAATGTATSRAGTPTPTTTPTATPLPGVDTGLNPNQPVVCTPNGTSLCEFTIPFAPRGLPGTAVYRIAERPAGSSDGWAIQPAPLPTGSVDVPVFDGPVVVDVGSQLTTTVQIAVLVFLRPPANLPAHVAELADTGADFAFVTNGVAVIPSP